MTILRLFDSETCLERGPARETLTMTMVNRAQEVNQANKERKEKSNMLAVGSASCATHCASWGFIFVQLVTSKKDQLHAFDNGSHRAYHFRITEQWVCRLHKLNGSKSGLCLCLILQNTFLVHPYHDQRARKRSHQTWKYSP